MELRQSARSGPDSIDVTSGQQLQMSLPRKDKLALGLPHIAALRDELAANLGLLLLHLSYI